MSISKVTLKEMARQVKKQGKSLFIVGASWKYYESSIIWSSTARTLTRSISYLVIAKDEKEAIQQFKAKAYGKINLDDVWYMKLTKKKIEAREESWKQGGIRLLDTANIEKDIKRE